MKVLYAIQSTGNGHISRAKEIIPYLERRFQFDIMLSGPKNELDLGYPIKYHFKGVTFFYDKKGAINWPKTVFKNNILQFAKDVFSLRVQEYDLILTDFEPISAWACKLRGVLSFGVSNQISLWQKKVPKPKKRFRVSVKYLRNFAPTKLEYGIHYERFNKRIFLPIIRSKIKALKTTKGGGIVVYLPSYTLENTKAILSLYPEVKWTVFSKETKETTSSGSLTVCPINEDNFIEKLAQCDGVVTNAGFATTSEALYLGKPLFVVPMRGHVEQNYNAFALQKMGVTVVKKLSAQNSQPLTKWLQNPKVVKVPFDNDLNLLVDQIALDYIKCKYTGKMIYG